MPKNLLRYYWKTIVVCVLIFVLSTVTFTDIPDVAKFRNSDKLTHAIMYVGLGFIAFMEYKKDNRFSIKYNHFFLYMFGFFVIFGGIIEILQGTIFKPRTSEFADWIADIFGLFIGVVVAKLFFKVKK